MATATNTKLLIHIHFFALQLLEFSKVLQTYWFEGIRVKSFRVGNLRKLKEIVYVKWSVLLSNAWTFRFDTIFLSSKHLHSESKLRWKAIHVDFFDSNRCCDIMWFEKSMNCFVIQLKPNSVKRIIVNLFLKGVRHLSFTWRSTAALLSSFFFSHEPSRSRKLLLVFDCETDITHPIFE